MLETITTLVIIVVIGGILGYIIEKGEYNEGEIKESLRNYTIERHDFEYYGTTDYRSRKNNLCGRFEGFPSFEQWYLQKDEVNKYESIELRPY